MTKKIFQISAAALCALAAAFVLLPLVRGERCAMGMWAAFLLLFAGYTAACGVPRKLSTPLKKLWRAAIACICIWLLLSGVLFAAMYRRTAQPLPEQVDAILVPGCLVTEAGLSPMLQRRCDAALQLAQRYPDAAVILSGGQGRAEPCTEASAMQSYLLSRGMPAQRMLMDETALNTAQNLAAAAQLLQGQAAEGTLLVVSDDFHLLRIGYLADRLGLNVSLTASSRSTAMSLCYWFREQPGLLRALLLGY